ncbi:MAG: glycerate kinase [Ruminococcus sp.]|nr:glycerate kinase [Ruminococcus sp.]
MKLVFASDSFKGSLTSEKTAELLMRAAHEVFSKCECIGVPVADGGEGTVDAMITALDGERVTALVHDPMMHRIPASYAVIGNKAVIEMAEASGLTLIPQELRDPMKTTTFGTGELIFDALDRGCHELFVAIGGCATNDGGMGCMRALGAKFLDRKGSELSGCGRDLTDVSAIDLDGLDNRLSKAKITVLCDVKNPLCGDSGATYTFAEQKGATPEMMEALENGMCNFRDIICRQFGIDCDLIEGAGAAGGLGAALKVFLHAEMRSGIDTMLDLIGFDDILSRADLVITGEGRADAQSCCGKVVQGVALRAKEKGIPVIGLCGSIGDGAEKLYDFGITSLVSISDSSMSLDYAMKNAEQLYYKAAVRLFCQIQENGI